MTKIDFNKRLSKKGTAIAVVCIVLFILLGFVAAIVGHVVYLHNQEAKIVNYKHREGAELRMRNDGTLVYVYDNKTTVDVKEVLELSEGASLRVVRVVSENRVLPTTDKINVAEEPHVYLLLQVVSEAGNKTTNYYLEIVSKEEYQPDGQLPPVIVGDTPIIQ